jgi:hypothetical protein
MPNSKKTARSMAKSASTTETKAHSPPNDGEFPQPARDVIDGFRSRETHPTFSAIGVGKKRLIVLIQP